MSHPQISKTTHFLGHTMDHTETKVLLPTRRDIASRIFRQRGVFIVTFLIVVTGFVVTGQFKPKYRAEMKVLVSKQRVDPIVTTGQDSTPQLQTVNVREEDLNSEAEILKGEDLLRQLVPAAGLVGADSMDAVAVEQAVRKLQKHLDVSVVAKTDLIAVRYESQNPDQSRRVLATLAALYLKKQRSVHGPDFQVSFFSQQVEEHSSALHRAEQKLLDFTRATGVVSASLQRELTVRQLEDLNQAKRTNDAEIAEAKARTSQLDTQIESEPTRLVTDRRKADNPQLLNQLNATLLSLQLKRTDLLAKYDPRYRLVLDVDQEIATTQAMIKVQLATPLHDETTAANPTHLAIANSLVTSRAELAGYRAKGAQLSSAAAAIEQTAQDLAEKDTQQEALLRDVKTEKDQYQLYVDKLEQARMTSSLNEGGILNVELAEDPSAPALPQNAPLVVLAAVLFAGTLLGLGTAFLADVFDPTVRNTSELSDVLGLPLLAEFSPIHSLEGVNYDNLV
jgi:uncharacterized protein involved in exopolysaccharide biosynthesis